MTDVELPVMPPVSPMLAKPVAAIPEGQHYEPKWDGFRSVVFRDGDEVGDRATLDDHEAVVVLQGEDFAIEESRVVLLGR